MQVPTRKCSNRAAQPRAIPRRSMCTGISGPKAGRLSKTSAHRSRRQLCARIDECSGNAAAVLKRAPAACLPRSHSAYCGAFWRVRRYHALPLIVANNKQDNDCFGRSRQANRALLAGQLSRRFGWTGGFRPESNEIEAVLRVPLMLQYTCHEFTALQAAFGGGRIPGGVGEGDASLN